MCLLGSKIFYDYVATDYQDPLFFYKKKASVKDKISKSFNLEQKLIRDFLKKKIVKITNHLFIKIIKKKG